MANSEAVSAAAGSAAVAMAAAAAGTDEAGSDAAGSAAANWASGSDEYGGWLVWGRRRRRRAWQQRRWQAGGSLEGGELGGGGVVVDGEGLGDDAALLHSATPRRPRWGLKYPASAGVPRGGRRRNECIGVRRLWLDERGRAGAGCGLRARMKREEARAPVLLSSPSDALRAILRARTRAMRARAGSSSVGAEGERVFRDRCAAGSRASIPCPSLNERRCMRSAFVIFAKGVVIIGDHVDSAENPWKSLEFQIVAD